MSTSKVTRRSAPTLLLLRNVDRLGRNHEGKADLRVADFFGNVVQELCKDSSPDPEYVLVGHCMRRRATSASSPSLTAVTSRSPTLWTPSGRGGPSWTGRPGKWGSSFAPTSTSSASADRGAIQYTFIVLETVFDHFNHFKWKMNH